MALVSSSLVLLMGPVSGDSLDVSLWFAVSAACIAVLGNIFIPDPPTVMALCFVPLPFRSLVGCAMRYGHLQPLFSTARIWTGVELDARGLYTNLTCIAAMAAMICA